jgi:hypothetical protein
VKPKLASELIDDEAEFKPEILSPKTSPLCFERVNAATFKELQVRFLKTDEDAASD